jgi:hypothetical protein
VFALSAFAENHPFSKICQPQFHSSRAFQHAMKMGYLMKTNHHIVDFPAFLVVQERCVAILKPQSYRRHVLRLRSFARGLNQSVAEPAYVVTPHAHNWYDLVDFLADLSRSDRQIVLVLQIKPELRTGVERLAEPRAVSDVMPVVSATMRLMRVRGTPVALASAPGNAGSLLELLESRFSILKS